MKNHKFIWHFTRDNCEKGIPEWILSNSDIKLSFLGDELKGRIKNTSSDTNITLYEGDIITYDSQYDAAIVYHQARDTRW